MTSLNSRLCFGRTRRADNINSKRSQRPWWQREISLARQVMHTLIQIRFLFTFWFDLLPVTSRETRRIGILSATPRHCWSAFMATNYESLISTRWSRACKADKGWLESGLRCFTMRCMVEINYRSARVLCQKPASSDRSLADLRSFSESVGNRRKWKSGLVGRECNTTTVCENDFHFSPAKPHRRLVWHH